MNKKKSSAYVCMLTAIALVVSCDITINSISWRNPQPGVSAPVDSAGGEIVLSNDEGIELASLSIPVSALAESVILSITEEQIAQPLLSNVFRLEPDGQSFQSPVTLAIDCTEVVAATDIAPENLCLYILSDLGLLSPIFSSVYDEELGAVTAPIMHFSDGLSGPRPEQMSSLDIAAIAEALGIELSTEYLAMLHEVFDLYVVAIYNPWLDTSLSAGVAAVTEWCNGDADLTPGAGWVDDSYIVGWDLAVVVHKADLRSEPAGTGTFTHIGYSARGDVQRPDDERYLQMVCQSQVVRDPELGVNALQVFDIDIKQNLSNPQLSAQVTGEVAVDQGTSVEITGRLWCSYETYGSQTTSELGIGSESIVCEVSDGSGSFSSSSVITAVDGTFSATFTSDWSTSEVEPEVSFLTVKFVRGNIELSEQFTVTEDRTELIVSTAPQNGAVDVALDSSIEIVFAEAMDTDSVDAALSIFPSLGFTRVWDMGQTRLTLMPDVGLDAGETYIVTIAETEGSQAGATLSEAYSFSFSTLFDGLYVVSVTPAANAVDVPVGTSIVVTFSEAMDITTTEAAFRLTSPSLDTISFIPSWSGAFDWNAAGTEMTFLPGSDLEQDEIHTVWVDETAVSGGGEFLAAWSSNFSTELKEDTEPPIVIDPRLSLVNETGTQGVSVDFELASDNLTQQWFVEFRVVYSTGNNIGTPETATANGIPLTDWAEQISYMVSGIPIVSVPSGLIYINVIVRDSAGNLTVYNPVQCGLLTISQWMYTDISRDSLVENESYIFNMAGEVGVWDFGNWEPYGTYTYENGRLTIVGELSNGQSVYENHPFYAHWEHPDGDTFGTYGALEKVSGDVDTWPGTYRREFRVDRGPGSHGTRIRELILNADGTLTDYIYIEYPYDNGPDEETRIGVWRALPQGIERSYVNQADGSLYYTRTVFDFFFTVADTYYFYIYGSPTTYF